MRFSFGVFVAAFVSFFALAGCLFAEPVQGSGVVQDAPLKFANDRFLDEHWRKHGLNPAEFKPTLSREEYLKAARDFFALKRSEVEIKERPNGDVLRYRISTNEFGVLSSRKVIRTYFRPDSGIRYWNRQ